MQKTIFWDLDGTLIDSMRTAWKFAMQKTFQAFGVTPPTFSEYFRLLTEHDGDYVAVYHELGVEESQEDLNAVYLPAFRERLWDVDIMPGSLFVLRELHQRGWRQILVTTQLRELVDATLGPLEPFFDLIGVSVKDKKRFIRAHCSDPTQTWFVGDSPTDITHGNNAGCRTIALVSQLGAAEDRIPEDLVQQANPNYIVHDLHDVLSICDPATAAHLRRGDLFRGTLQKGGDAAGQQYIFWVQGTFEGSRAIILEKVFARNVQEGQTYYQPHNGDCLTVHALIRHDVDREAVEMMREVALEHSVAHHSNRTC